MVSTYSGMFDHVRRIFADTPLARRRHYSPGRFSFNVAQGRCPVCEGEGYVMVELLFLPSVFALCSTCHGSRYNPQTLEVEWNGRNIAQVLEVTVDDACDFFAGDPTDAGDRPLLRPTGGDGGLPVPAIGRSLADYPDSKPRPGSGRMGAISSSARPV